MHENATSFSKHTDSPKIQVTRRNQLIRCGSKTMKTGNMFSNELECQDARLASSSHPMTCFVLHHIDGVSSPLTCASVLCIREDWIKPNRTEAILHRTALCWSWKKKPSALAQRWTPGWLGATGEQLNWRRQQMATAVCFWHDSCAGWVQVAGFRDHNLRRAFWMEYLSDTLQITILKRNLDLQIMEHLTQSSKSHYSWHTLGTRLCHK